MSHIDNNIKPTVKVLKLKDKIPKSDVTLKRNLVKFNYADELDKLEVNNKKQKRLKNSLKCIFEKRVKKKNGLYASFLRGKMNTFEETKDICWTGTSTLESYVPINNCYREALMKPVSTSEMFKFAKKKFDNSVKKIKKKNLDVVFETMERVEKIKKQVDEQGFITNVKNYRFYPKNPENFKLRLNNYYGVLESYLDETIGEVIEPINASDVDFSVRFCSGLIDKMSVKKFKRLIFGVLGFCKVDKFLLKQAGFDFKTVFDNVLMLDPKELEHFFFTNELEYRAMKQRKIKKVDKFRWLLMDKRERNKIKRDRKIRLNLKRGEKRKCEDFTILNLNKRMRLQKYNRCVNVKKLRSMILMSRIQKRIDKRLEEKKRAEEEKLEEERKLKALEEEKIRVEQQRILNERLLSEKLLEEIEMKKVRKIEMVERKKKEADLRILKKKLKDQPINIEKGDPNYYHDGVALFFEKDSYKDDSYKTETKDDVFHVKTPYPEPPFFYRFKYFYDFEHCVCIDEMVKVSDLTLTISDLNFISIKKK